MIILSDAGSVACSFVPPLDHGEDFLGLMAKRDFADQVVLSFVQAAQHQKG